MSETREILVRGFCECDDKEIAEEHGQRITEITLKDGSRVKGFWVVGGLIHFEKTPYIIGDAEDVTSDYISPIWWAPVIPETIGQYTGEREYLIDSQGHEKIGKRFFDGDILSIESEEDGNGTYLIFWDDEHGRWWLKNISGAAIGDCTDNVKAIGNRWNNPEFLSTAAKNKGGDNLGKR